MLNARPLPAIVEQNDIKYIKKLGSEVYFKVQHVSVSCLCQKLQIKVQKSFLFNFTEFVRKELVKMAYKM